MTKVKSIITIHISYNKTKTFLVPQLSISWSRQLFPKISLEPTMHLDNKVHTTTKKNQSVVLMRIYVLSKR